MSPTDRTSLPPLSPLELGRLRWNLSALCVQVKLLRLAVMLRKANFNPLQLRIPQGNEGAGRWTDDPRWGWSGGDEEGRVRVAQIFRDPSFYYFNLDEVYRRGDGHAYPRHVGRSELELLSAVVGSEYLAIKDSGETEWRFHPAEGSFADINSANNFVAEVLRHYRDEIEAVIAGRLSSATLTYRFGYRTGYEAYMAEPFGSAIIRPTYAVEVIIVPDYKNGSRGYRVLTAYPMNESPNEVPR
jgi:hypothetical protein